MTALGSHNFNNPSDFKGHMFSWLSNADAPNQQLSSLLQDLSEYFIRSKDGQKRIQIKNYIHNSKKCLYKSK